MYIFVLFLRVVMYSLIGRDGDGDSDGDGANANEGDKMMKSSSLKLK